MKTVSKLRKSKVAAAIGLLLIMAVVVLNMVLHAPWWAFIWPFLLFMSGFTHLVALLTERMNPPASRKLERVATVCGLTGTVALIVVVVVLALC